MAITLFASTFISWYSSKGQKGVYVLNKFRVFMNIWSYCLIHHFWHGHAPCIHIVLEDGMAFVRHLNLDLFHLNLVRNWSSYVVSIDSLLAVSADINLWLHACDVLYLKRVSKGLWSSFVSVLLAPRWIEPTIGPCDCQFFSPAWRWSNELGGEPLNFPSGLGGGWGQSAGNRGFRELEPVCKPGPNFDSCSRDQLVGTGGVVLAIALFVGLSGFVVWFVVSDQWFVLKDQMRALRSRHRRWFAHALASVASARSLRKGMRIKERVDSIAVIGELVQVQSQVVMASNRLGMWVKLSLLRWSSPLFSTSKSHLLLLFGS